MHMQAVVCMYDAQELISDMSMHMNTHMPAHISTHTGVYVGRRRIDTRRNLPSIEIKAHTLIGPMRYCILMACA